ncbi:MAG: hypothetical protein NDF55_00305 [archaeon GB-1867-005]|nr:hypothetical protein [Candidatus Culexmicrobium cathedralense]
MVRHFSSSDLKVHVIAYLILISMLVQYGLVFDPSLQFLRIAHAQREFDYFYIFVKADGTVVAGIKCNYIELPFYIPYIPSSEYADHYLEVMYVVDDGLSCELMLNLNVMSESEADVHAANIKKALEDWLGIQFELKSRRRQSVFAAPLGITIKNIFYNFTSENFNQDVIIDKFLSLKPDQGWMILINRKNLSKGDRFLLQIYPGSRFGRLLILKYFYNYFNFKVGNTYTLDVFKLFNFTGPLKIHPMAEHNSRVEIWLLSYGAPSNIQAQIINIEIPFDYRVLKRTCANRQCFTIENFDGRQYTLTGGDVVEYLRVTFKIVEYGYKMPDIGVQNVIGIILACMAVLLSVALVYRIRSRRHG